MAVVLGLLTALAYGVSDFAAGVGGRRLGAANVAFMVHVLALLVAVVGVGLEAHHRLTTQATLWGLAAGLGSATGTLALYRGFVVGRISVVAPLSAVVAAVVPALTGLALGDQLSGIAGAGLVTAVPAIALVSWQPATYGSASTRPGVIEGLVSGAGFALLFVALDRAGTGAGSWPLVPGLAFGSLLILPFVRKERRPRRPDRRAIGLLVTAGLSGGGANLLFLSATGVGQLSIVVVLTALYPAVTILLARVCLGERWNLVQSAGLVAAAAAVTLIVFH